MIWGNYAQLGEAFFCEGEEKFDGEYWKKQLCIKFSAAVVGSAERAGVGSAPASPTLPKLPFARGSTSGARRSSTLGPQRKAPPARRYQASGQPCGKYLSRNRNFIGWGAFLTHGSCHRAGISSEPPLPMRRPRGPTPRPFGVRRDTGPHRRAIHFTHVQRRGPNRRAEKELELPRHGTYTLRCAGSLLTLRHSAGGRPPFRHPPRPAANAKPGGKENSRNGTGVRDRGGAKNRER